MDIQLLMARDRANASNRSQQDDGPREGSIDPREVEEERRRQTELSFAELPEAWKPQPSRAQIWPQDAVDSRLLATLQGSRGCGSRHNPNSITAARPSPVLESACEGLP
mmetsp:Transcript_581/g.1092  ORF Transcript_581/g.1092 Transcript_581/m.1092 type:complete len:109 (+) Transcript_581:2126-2452(+)